MKGKKNLLACVLEKSRLLNLSYNIPANTLTVINYHRIYADKLNTEFDADVFGPSVTEFEQQIAFLRERVNLLSEQDLIELITTGKSIPGRSALITFDDGYRDNYQLAVPVLKKYRVPAIFFIPTKSIEQSMLGWWDIISYFINHTNKQQISFNENTIPLRTRKERDQAKQLFLNYMKSVPHEQSKNLLTDLSEICNTAFPPRSRQREELMSWEQIKEIANTDFLSIGSHTLSHRVLSTIDAGEEHKELRDSREFLQQKLAGEINSIAYPVGGYHAFSERTKRNAYKAGYQLGFSFNTGTNHGCITDPFDIKRVGPENELSLYKSTVMLPRLFSSTTFFPKHSATNFHRSEPEPS